MIFLPFSDSFSFEADKCQFYKLAAFLQCENALQKSFHREYTLTIKQTKSMLGSKPDEQIQTHFANMISSPHAWLELGVIFHVVKYSSDQPGKDNEDLGVSSFL